MSKRIRILLITTVIIVVAVFTYFALTYQSPEDWLKDYLYEVYGGKQRVEQGVKMGEDGKYYAYTAFTPDVTYEHGVFKAKRTFEHCLQPEYNFYEGNDIFITTDKPVYKYGEDEIIYYTIYNNSGKIIWPSGTRSFDIEINVKGQWYAIYLYNAFPSDLMPGGDIKPGDTLETRIYPTRISGFPTYDVYKFGGVYAVPTSFKLRPGFYRIVDEISLLPQDDGLDTTYITCTFTIK